MKPGKLEVLDIDDTFCAAHGGQQLAFWNAHHDERGFASMHIYHVASGTPSGGDPAPGAHSQGQRGAHRHQACDQAPAPHWPKTRIVWRGDSHYGRVEAMDWAENNDATTFSALPAIRWKPSSPDRRHLRFATLGSSRKLRHRASVQAGTGPPRSSSPGSKLITRPQASQEIDIRCVVTSLKGSAQHIYENVYCQRGQMENLIKLHKAQLASDRMSCHSSTANQVRLVLHTAAFWLMHGVRAAIPKTNPLAKCEFATIRERLIKIAARVIEHVARIRVQLPTTCPDAALFRYVARGLMPSGP